MMNFFQYGVTWTYPLIS